MPRSGGPTWSLVGDAHRHTNKKRSPGGWMASAHRCHGPSARILHRPQQMATRNLSMRQSGRAMTCISQCINAHKPRSPTAKLPGLRKGKKHKSEQVGNDLCVAPSMSAKQQSGPSTRYSAAPATWPFFCGADQSYFSFGYAPHARPQFSSQRRCFSA